MSLPFLRTLQGDRFFQLLPVFVLIVQRRDH